MKRRSVRHGTERPLVAMMSIVVTDGTRRAYRQIEALGFQPVIVCRRTPRKIAEVTSIIGPDAAKWLLMVSDLERTRTALEEILELLKRRGWRLHSCVNVVDRFSAVVIALAERLQLHCSYLTGYINCRLKPLARKLVRPVVSCRVVRLTGRRRVPTPLTLPFVAKPVMGAGSHLVSMIRTGAQWRDYVRLFRREVKPDATFVRGFLPSRDVLVEEALQGQMFQADGYVHRGVARICGLGFKFHCLNEGNLRQGFLELGGLQYRPHARKYNRDRLLCEWVARTLRRLELRDGTFHIEGVIRGSSVKLIEANPRPGGSEVVPIVRMLSGIDLSRETFRLWLGKEPSRQAYSVKCSSVLYAIVYPPGVCTVTSIRRPGRYKVRLNGRFLWAVWKPSAVLRAQLRLRQGKTSASGKNPVGRSKGIVVGRTKGEEYLGELHVVDSRIPAAKLNSSVTCLGEYLMQKGFIRFDRHLIDAGAVTRT